VTPAREASGLRHASHTAYDRAQRVASGRVGLVIGFVLAVAEATVWPIIPDFAVVPMAAVARLRGEPLLCELQAARHRVAYAALLGHREVHADVVEERPRRLGEVVAIAGESLHRRLAGVQHRSVRILLHRRRLRRGDEWGQVPVDGAAELVHADFRRFLSLCPSAVCASEHRFCEEQPSVC